MKYFVYVGGVTLYGVTDVTETADRNIEVYDGVGQGNFPVGGSAGLRSWEISCELTELDDRPGQEWTSAKRIFKKLESFRESKNPQRLVITSNYGKTSVQALLESCSKAEKETGVYDVKIKLTEYKPVSKKTTNVPYVERPGKVPIAETVVFNSATEVAQDAMQRLRHNTTTDPSGFVNPDAKAIGPEQFKGLSYQWIDKDGKVQTTTNPNIVPTKVNVTVKNAESKLENSLANRFASAIVPPKNNFASKAFDAMGEALKKFWDKGDIYMG